MTNPLVGVRGRVTFTVLAVSAVLFSVLGTIGFVAVADGGRNAIRERVDDVLDQLEGNIRAGSGLVTISTADGVRAGIAAAGAADVRGGRDQRRAAHRGGRYVAGARRQQLAGAAHRQPAFAVPRVVDRHPAGVGRRGADGRPGDAPRPASGGGDHRAGRHHRHRRPPRNRRCTGARARHGRRGRAPGAHGERHARADRARPPRAAAVHVRRGARAAHPADGPAGRAGADGWPGHRDRRRHARTPGGARPPARRPDRRSGAAVDARRGPSAGARADVAAWAGGRRGGRRRAGRSDQRRRSRRRPRSAAHGPGSAQPAGQRRPACHAAGGGHRGGRAAGRRRPPVAARRRRRRRTRSGADRRRVPALRPAGRGAQHRPRGIGVGPGHRRLGGAGHGGGVAATTGPLGGARVSLWLPATAPAPVSSA